MQIVAVDKNNKDYVVPSNFLDGCNCGTTFSNLITDYTLILITDATEDKTLAKNK